MTNYNNTVRIYALLLLATLMMLSLNAQIKVLPKGGIPASGVANKLQMPPPVPQKGGMMFTERGVVRGVVVFVQFAEDSLAPDAPLWPLESGPVYLHEVVDSTLEQRSGIMNLTNRIRAMSFNQLHIIGDAFLMVTEHPKQWYLDEGKNFSDINREVLQKLDETVDFAAYDQWTFGSRFNHRNTPDGILDLVIVMHREKFYGTFGLYNGISVVCYGSSDLPVDNGKRRIKRGFPGSGYTLDGGINGPNHEGGAHEIGHKWFGAGHAAYSDDPGGVKNYALWGTMIGHNGFINAYERAWIGWSDLPDITSDSAIVTVSDYITTGDAYRIPITGTRDEAFVIENRQEISPYDKPAKYQSAKGLYIYHVRGSGPMPRYDLEAAEGRFDWENPYWIQNPWGLRATDSIPVFKRLAPNPAGRDALDAIPTSKKGANNSHSPAYFKVFAEDSAGVAITTRKVFGSPEHAFRFDGKRIFSPATNPNSHRWDNTTPSGITIEIIAETIVDSSAVYTVKIVRDTTAL